LIEKYTFLIHGSNKSENQKEKTNSTLNSQPHPRHSTPKGKLHASHPTPSLQSPPATRGGMAHEEQNDPVAQSSMYQRRPPNLVASTADLSERDIKENPVVKEEEINDTEVFEEVVVEVYIVSGFFLVWLWRSCLSYPLSTIFYIFALSHSRYL